MHYSADHGDNGLRIADYWEDLRESDDTFGRPRLTPVTLKFDPIVLKKIKMLARKRVIPYNAYVRYLLAKGVEDEISIKRPLDHYAPYGPCRFVTGAKDWSSWGSRTRVSAISPGGSFRRRSTPPTRFESTHR